MKTIPNEFSFSFLHTTLMSVRYKVLMFRYVSSDFPRHPKDLYRSKTVYITLYFTLYHNTLFKNHFMIILFIITFLQISGKESKTKQDKANNYKANRLQTKGVHFRTVALDNSFTVRLIGLLVMVGRSHHTNHFPSF